MTGIEESRWRTVYDLSPGWARSVATTVFSLHLRPQRFGRHFARHLASLEESQWLPTGELVERSRRRAEEFLADARAGCTHFGAFESDDRPPILEKSAVRLSTASFVHRDVESLGPLQRKSTTGTTGSPLQLVLTSDAVQRENAFSWQHRTWHGCPRGVRAATIAGHAVTPSRQTRPPYWVHNWAERQLLFSPYHMTRETLRHYARALAEFKPELIHGYPSSIAMVGAAALELGLRIRPRAVITASEMTQPMHRRTIREAFGREPRIWYGNGELAGNIVECPEGRLHVREEHSWLEFLNADGQPAAVGESARLIATAFGNRAMYLVRYDVGDQVVLSDEQTCPCGRGGRLVSSILGRSEDYVLDSAGRIIGSLEQLFYDVPGIREAQVEQFEPGELIFRIVRAGEPHPEAEAIIRAEAAKILSPGTRLVFEYVHELRRGKGGKSAFIIAHTHPAEALLEPEFRPTRPGAASRRVRKVVTVVGPLPPPIGGVSIHTLRLRDELRRRGWEVDVLAAGRRRPFEPFAGHYLANSPLRHVLQVMLRARGVVHVQDRLSPLTLLAVVAARLRRRPVVLTVHGVPLKFITRRGGIDVFRRLALPQAATVIAVNAHVADRLRPYAGNVPIAVIPAYIPPTTAEIEQIDTATKVWIDEPGAPPLASFMIYRVLAPLAGADRDIYGLRTTTEAIERLAAEDGRLRLALLLAQPPQSDDERSYLDVMCARLRRVLGDDFRLLVGESAPPVISRSDLFLRPTTTDGDAVSVREALELGVPVVASDAVPRPDAVVLYRAGDLADFVAKVREALERGRDGAVAVPQESAVDAIERIYEKLLGAVALGRGAVDDERAVGRAR